MTGALKRLSDTLEASAPWERVRHALRYQVATLHRHRGGRPAELGALFEKLEETAKADPAIEYSGDATLLDYLLDPSAGGNCHVSAAIAALRAADREIPGRLAIYDAHVEYLRPSMKAVPSFDDQKLRRLCAVTNLAGVRRAFVGLPLRYAGLRRRRRQRPTPTRYYIGDDDWELVARVAAF